MRHPNSLWSNWHTAAVVALLLLGLQLLYTFREPLLQTSWGSYFADYCRTPAWCAPATPQNPQYIKLLDRRLFSMPEKNNVLILQAEIMNQAEHPKPYPILVLNLADIKGEKIAARQFQPQEYLPENWREQLMPIQTPIAIGLELVDPGYNATTFELDFFQ